MHRMEVRQGQKVSNNPRNEHSCTLTQIWTVLIFLVTGYTFSKEGDRRLEVIGGFSMPSLVLQQLTLLSKVPKISQMVA